MIFFEGWPSRQPFFMLKITYIHTTDLAANDTSATFVVNNALSLAEEGAEITLLVTNSSKRRGEEMIRERFHLDKLPPKLHVVDYKKKIRSSLGFYTYCFFYVLRLPANHVIITRTHRVLPFILPVKRGKRIFFETHDFFYDLSIRDDVDQERRKKKSRIERRYFPRLDGLICLNNHQKKLYEKYLDIPVNVFPTGLKKVFKHDKTESKDIVYIGSLNKRLGISRIVELSLKLKEFRFIVVGGKTPEDIEAFKQLYPEGKLPENVKITGWIGKKELHQILVSASIGLLPLTDTFFNRYLTVPLKLFDYLAYGIITIAPDYPSCTEFIEDKVTGFTVDWDQTDKVIKLITEINLGVNKSEFSDQIFSEAEAHLWSNRALNQVKYLTQKYV